MIAGHARHVRYHATQSVTGRHTLFRCTRTYVHECLHGRVGAESAMIAFPGHYRSIQIYLHFLLPPFFAGIPTMSRYPSSKRLRCKRARVGAHFDILFLQFEVEVPDFARRCLSLQWPPSIFFAVIFSPPLSYALTFSSLIRLCYRKFGGQLLIYIYFILFFKAPHIPTRHVDKYKATRPAPGNLTRMVEYTFPSDLFLLFDKLKPRKRVKPPEVLKHQGGGG
ncbi:T. brucei spp.-specific protein [Trypanosoma brucei gambiense DAL972]|uniref:T. brucei spp.-specific protein n=1 Tax=Trypanosoma brucei gambiense (strain MHOM/CI/86/DAL972) TaxID=679716 RepID=C9ZSR1_TRYB9|nr:T. brucei spp.-specific protein [Trypanosoma brucei gambiense DAL972]CBH12445.1 T. brucei spp.-specific protein [Trypanosoma brucei gambiense DAL972]|eukprot:XP_011774726.1 T. brucei spp.-specific protein [Trypanosoma brucei gambiense DAL972]